MNRSEELDEAVDKSEELDEDNLKLDPLEEGVEPPEHWAEGDRFGTTAREQREGEGLEERLREEQQDFSAPAAPARPVAATPAEGLDESVDYVNEDQEQVAPPEPVEQPRSAADERGQNADEGGGSVADAIRTPEEPD